MRLRSWLPFAPPATPADPIPQGEPTTLLAIAASAAATAEQLAALARHPDTEVRRAVARHPRTPGPALVRLLDATLAALPTAGTRDPVALLRASRLPLGDLLAHPALPVADQHRAAERLLGDPPPTDASRHLHPRQHLARLLRRPDLDPALALTLWPRLDADRRAELLCNVRACPPTLLEAVIGAEGATRDGRLARRTRLEQLLAAPPTAAAPALATLLQQTPDDEIREAASRLSEHPAAVAALAPHTLSRLLARDGYPSEVRARLVAAARPATPPRR